MNVETWPLDRLIPYARNARKIPQVAIDKVAASIKEFGWKQPIVVDKDGVIVVGHTRLLAAQKLGLSEAPVVIASDLSPAQIKAYRLADNRVHQETAFESEMLALELEDIKALDYDLSLTAFDPDELRSLEALLDATKDGLTDEDAAPEPPAEPVTVPGDLWILGKHRLLCGDSTVITDVERLMGGQKADMVFTDPPYNVDYDPESRKSTFSAERKAHKLGKIANDAKSPGEFRQFLDAVYSNCDASLNCGRAVYICHADTEGHHFRSAFIAQPWTLQSCLIWKKSVLVFGRADYHWMHEPILYGWKDGASHLWAGDRKQTTIWEIASDHYNKAASDTGGKYVHPTQKPVSLIVRAVDNSSRSGDIVLDLFGGSGSTMIACEKTGREARLMELEPKYCDVICQRWQDFTGKLAMHEDGTSFTERQAIQNSGKVTASAG